MVARKVGPLVFFVVALIGLRAQAQNEAQFRTGVELIQLDVVVLDGNRQPVRGLTAADFTVLDNGAATRIRAFTPVELAARNRATEAVWADEVSPDVVTNQVGGQEGRLVIILMDRSIPVQEPTAVARRIAAAAVDALGPLDLAAVISTNNGAVQNSTIQNLTSDRTRLLRAINAADPSTGLSVEAQEIPTMGKLDPRNDGRCLCGLCVLETITRVAEAVQNVPQRRKSLLFIGSNVIWQSARGVVEGGQDVACESRLRDARAAMFAAVDRTNLTVHSIDPRGLTNVGPQTRVTAMGAQKGPDSAGPRARLEAQQSDTNDLLASQGALRVLPDRTGGRTVVGANNPERTVPEIFRESEAYYVLGVERGRTDGPEATRAIDVKVGREGLHAYAQRQYQLQPAKSAGTGTVPVSATSSGEALTRLLPSASLPLVLAVTAFAGQNSGKAIVRTNVDVGAFARSDGSDVSLDIALLASDRTGKPVASARQTTTIAIPRVASGRPVEVNVPSHLELPAGDYAVRVAVSERATGRVASVFSDVTVPEFDSAALSLSGVTLEIAGTPSEAPATTTRRIFHSSDRVRALVQVYQGTSRTDALAPVVMRVQILDAKGMSVHEESLPVGVTTFADRRTDCVLAIPLATLPHGEYLLKLEASADQRRSGRALRFTIE
jgi:VWFA-related protein